MTTSKGGTDIQRRGRAIYGHRLRKMRNQGLNPLPGGGDNAAIAQANAAVDCGWGRLLFCQTFETAEAVSDALRSEGPDQRDIAVYVRDPHVLLAQAPQELFLDPSHTYRLDLAHYRAGKRRSGGFFIRRITSEEDAFAINRIYAARGMVQVPPEFFWSRRDSRAITYFVAEDEASGAILGSVTGIDHAKAFGDAENGASLWCLAVDPQATHPGIGEMLVRRLAEHYKARGNAFMDLSVMHDNELAIALYEKLGFRRVPFFAIKRKNTINEKLYTERVEGYEQLNPYARIIVDEAMRRGIYVDIADAAAGFFNLSYGGTAIRCRESLSEMTSAVAMSICDDKTVTRRMVAGNGVQVPEALYCDAPVEELAAFLERHGSVVVKPVQGEQGNGVAVGLRTLEDVRAAIDHARTFCSRVLIEQQAQGEDLRLVVIDFRVVAAALRRPPRITGTGQKTIAELVEAQSRRRAAATGGESRIPLDAETERTVRAAGYSLDDILPAGEELQVRKTANLHTGGTIHDVTGEVHPALIDAAIKAARAINIPVTGIDLIVRSPRLGEYLFIEANERPGLANHEPQPTAERFIDLLFPLSVPTAVRKAKREV